MSGKHIVVLQTHLFKLFHDIKSKSQSSSRCHWLTLLYWLTAEDIFFNTSANRPYKLEAIGWMSLWSVIHIWKCDPFLSVICFYCEAAFVATNKLPSRQTLCAGCVVDKSTFDWLLKVETLAQLIFLLSAVKWILLTYNTVFTVSESNFE